MIRSVGLSRTGHVDSAAPRHAGPEDARAVADLLIRSRRAAVGAIPAAVHPDSEVREWTRTVLIAEQEVWLMEDAGSRPLAVLALRDDWVDQLYVDPAFTGRGLGSHLIEFAKSHRPAGLQLWTFATNTGAQRFYLRHGFTVAETTDGTRNEENAPDIRFVWTAPR
ncbi:GNAT family N-acetyltransferase [Micromonospora sp. WMMD967]|uniref:GNAT family N-acetyltransferase n=1 Tax=Micromonospora sp. WMMD967 TaxID=3016101 RepID=UPI0024161C9D|nr:GNAT family N-acetyltransferase [Micromonospora sp. WMMD967]MDG4840269.1 GNAT family N-acetyltransferase [Micromonospora sp. WMMD967]